MKIMTHEQWKKGLYYTLVIEAKTEVFVKFNKHLDELYQKMKLEGSPPIMLKGDNKFI